jgi:hypothetical protein
MYAVVSQKTPYRAQREEERKGWMLRKKVVGTAVVEEGFVCNKNSSFRLSWVCYDQLVRLRRLTNQGRKTGRICTAKGKEMNERERENRRWSVPQGWRGKGAK